MTKNHGPDCDTQCASSIAIMEMGISRNNAPGMFDVETLWRYIQQLQLAASEPCRYRPVSPRRTGWKLRNLCSDAVFIQCCHLILHQRDQRRNNQPGAFSQHGWNLVAQGFAAAG